MPAPRLAVLVASCGDDFWASVAPRALACLEACSTFQMGDETRRAPAPPLIFVGHEGGDWARLGVELFPHGNNVDATELYTCHGGKAQGAALSASGSGRRSTLLALWWWSAARGRGEETAPGGEGQNTHGSGTVGGYGGRLGRSARPRRRLRTREALRRRAMPRDDVGHAAVPAEDLGARGRRRAR